MIVYTTGYRGEKTNRGDSKPARLAQLVEEMDATLFDIRFVPWSRAACWCRPALAKRLGARYRPLPQLGNRNYKGDQGEGFDIVDLRHGLEVVLLSERTPLLLCGCECYEGCHREYVTQWLEGYVEDVLEITHWGALRREGLG